jgi:U1 small nuclear ribonucleoprotein
MHSLFSLGTFIPKIPPSDLGFVCKPELPPHINILFRARPPLRFLKLPHKGIHRNYTGVFDLANNENILSKFEKEPPKNREIKLPKRVKKIIEIIKKIEIQNEINKERAKSWNPKSNSKVKGNPYKTLFVYRLAKNIDENVLKYEFEEFGQINDVRIIKNNKGVSKGYGFVEYVKTKDFAKALDNGNKKKINGRHVYVEAERGRTDSKFRPIKFRGKNGKGRDLPDWLEKDIENIKKKYPEIIKKEIEAELNKRKEKNEENKDGYKNKKNNLDLEMGEIDEDKNYNKKYEEDEYYLKKKRKNNRSPNAYSKLNNSEYSDESYSNRKHRSHRYESNSKYSYEEKNYDKKKKKKDNKEGSEEGEID